MKKRFMTGVVAAVTALAMSVSALAAGSIVGSIDMPNASTDKAGTGCVKRQENTGRKMGCGNRAYALSVFRIGSRMVMPLVCRQRTYMGSNTTTNLYSSPFPDLATNGENQQRQRAEHHIGRNLAQHAVIRDITDLGIDFMRWRKTR